MIDRYVDHVLSGKIDAPLLVRQACQRHVNDLRDGPGRGLWFDHKQAERVTKFFGSLKHYKGEWAGQPITLSAWQAFSVGSLFGWKHDNGLRRFRTAYLAVPRKNGKTTIAAGAGLYLAFADGEPAAEVYSAATKRDQARISHQDATQMVRNSPWLGREISVVRDNLHSLRTASKFEPLGRDTNTSDGLNVHAAICDEVHAWRGRDMWDVLETGMGARRQPLMLAITTAGFDRLSLCYQLHDYTEKVLSGVVEDDSFWGCVWSAEEGDDWEDEAVWWKANPNLGVSKSLDNMRQLASQAREMPTKLNAFLRLHLNVWTQVSTRWIAPDAWRACGGGFSWRDEERFTGRRCYAGLDLASTTDIAALVYVFPPDNDGGVYDILCRFWIPDDNITPRSRRDRVPYETWRREGVISATPGNVMDYDYILHQIATDRERFNLQELAFDRWGASVIVNQLSDMGIEVVQFGQGVASMSPPMKELEKLMLQSRLGHGNHPALSWMADNLVAVNDAAGNIKPDKSKSIEKIDGMVALIMALDRSLRHKPAPPSVYKSRGLRVLGGSRVPTV